jgi:hypothetical protein
VVERWVVTPAASRQEAAGVVPFTRIWQELDRLEPLR